MSLVRNAKVKKRGNIHYLEQRISKVRDLELYPSPFLWDSDFRGWIEVRGRGTKRRWCKIRRWHQIVRYLHKKYTSTPSAQIGIAQH